MEGKYFTIPEFPVKLIYTPADTEDIHYMEDAGFSGKPPYVRGVYANMYRGRLFTVRQLAGLGAPEDCNKRVKYLLDHGATGVSILLIFLPSAVITRMIPKQKAMWGSVGGRRFHLGH